MRLDESQLPAFLSGLKKELGLDLSDYRKNTLLRRINQYIQSVAIDNSKQILEYLKQDKHAFQIFINTITVNVTEFLRDPDVFKALYDTIFPKIFIHERADFKRTFRFWSAACSSGEEPYTLSLLVQEFLDNHKVTPCNVYIYGSDINSECLDHARKAVYSKQSLANISNERLRKYFLNVGDHFQPCDQIRERVRFRKHNLISDPPLKNFDLILCRNVMIYFKRDLQFKIMQNFAQTLNSKAHLVLGKIETLGSQGETLFNYTDRRLKIFSKIS